VRDLLLQLGLQAVIGTDAIGSLITAAASFRTDIRYRW
jgi:hypothetical protein